MINLESRIITFAVGIGLSIKAADESVKRAKKTGKEGYTIITDYTCSAETITTPEETNAHNYLAVHNRLMETNTKLEIIELHKKLLQDPATGLFNRLGYHVAIEELKQRGVNEGYFIYMDGNDMHGHNDKHGRDKVDASLRTIGKAITKQVRTINGDKKLGKRQHETYHDVVAYRVNDSGGDEFLLFLPLKISKENNGVVKSITQRILDSMYTAQKKILETN